jgi:hypothetical protein
MRVNITVKELVAAIAFAKCCDQTTITLEIEQSGVGAIYKVCDRFDGEFIDITEYGSF